MGYLENCLLISELYRFNQNTFVKGIISQFCHEAVKISWIFEAEVCIMNLKFLINQPQKTSKFEVRMRSTVLRFFEDTSKFLK